MTSTTSAERERFFCYVESSTRLIGGQKLIVNVGRVGYRAISYPVLSQKVIRFDAKLTDAVTAAPLALADLDVVLSQELASFPARAAGARARRSPSRYRKRGPISRPIDVMVDRVFTHAVASIGHRPRACLAPWRSPTGARRHRPARRARRGRGARQARRTPYGTRRNGEGARLRRGPGSSRAHVRAAPPSGTG